jgi:cyclophilin family peptidyl-prolyl cis-trans isomerase
MALLGLFGLLLAGCGQSAPPPPPTTLPTRPPASPPSAAQITSGQSPLPKPDASPSALPAASAAARGAPSAGARQFAAPPEMQLDPAAMSNPPTKKYTATINTSLGTMKAELFASEAPITVNNFVFLAKQGYYEGAPFHRIMKEFMVQTGDPVLRDGRGNPGYSFKDEPIRRPYERGTLAMANSGANTNGSQFFIVHGSTTALPPKYTIFGKLTDGLDVLDKLANVPVGPQPAPSNEVSKPLTEVDITSISIELN